MTTEAWLRGPLDGVDPRIAPLFYSFTQARDDLAHWTEGLSQDQIWARPLGLAPIGFQLRHIAGSIERLFTYVEGKQLSPEQLAAMKVESEPNASREELLRRLEEVTRNIESQVRNIDPATFSEPRTVGRKQLPTTVVGLLVHMAEHTHRHVGEAIVTARVIRATASA